MLETYGIANLALQGGTVKFRNDQIAPILGYGDLVQGAVMIKSVYYVEGLNHNLFSVGQFCNADLEVAFRKSTCCIRDLKGIDLLTATSSHAWLWHRRLSHLNFDTINLLSKNDIVVGLPKLKFVKDHLCSSCELGKAIRKSFHTKTTPSSKIRLQLLHMDLCGPMRVASINGKKYVLVIVDDYSRYTWTYFLRSKDETLKVLIELLRLVRRGLHAQVRIVPTDKGTKFLNKTLHAYFASEGIHHQTSVARTPKQNGVLERRNRTLVEAARTMLSAAKVPLLFWAEEKGDACIFVGYSTKSRAYRVFNKKTTVIVESIHVNFDELPQMASDHVSSDPGPEYQRMALEHDSLNPGFQCQENVTQADRTVATSNELDLLFSLMFNELLNGSSQALTWNLSTSPPQGVTQDLKKLELMVLGYKLGLKSVKERLKFFKTNESVYIEDIKLLKVEIQMKDIAIKELRRKLKVGLKEKGSIQLIVEKLKNASKSLNKLIDSQIMDNCKKGLGYNAVPPSHTHLFIPPKPDLSYISLEEFTSEPAVKNVNGEAQLYDKVDGKVVIFDASIKRNLKFEDEGRVNCLLNEVIFEQLTIMRYEKLTQKHLDSGNKFLMYPRFVQVFLNNQLGEMANHIRIYVAPYHTKKIFVNMKRVEKEFSRRVTSLFPTMMVQAQEEMGEGVNILQSGEDSLKHIELKKICTTLQKKVLDLEDELKRIKTAQQTTINGFKRRVKKLENKHKSRTHNLKRLYKYSLTTKVKLDADYELAERIQAEEQQELNEEEKAKLFMDLLKKRRKFFSAKRTKEKRNRPPTKAQKRSLMCTYLKNMDGWKPRALKNKSFAKIQELFDKAMKRINTFVDFRTKLMEESSKKAQAKITQKESLMRAGDELEQESSKKRKIDYTDTPELK
nr:hypothetical protein [Tanacetum cinerariifolium]